MRPDMDPLVVNALIGLVGVVVGSVMSTWTSRKSAAESNRLAELTLVTDTMQDELKRFAARVEALETKVRLLESDLEQSRRLYQRAVDYIRGLLAVLHATRGLVPEGVCAPETPPVPDEIAQDI